MKFATVVLRLVLSCLLICSAGAQAPQDPLKDFCRRYGHQTAIVDRKLYIDGGWVYANPIVQNPVPTMNQDLIYSDLDEAANLLPTQYANLTKNSTVPDVTGGILWPDEVNKVFWLYGGEFASAPSTFQLWGYDTLLNQWNLSNAAQTATSAVQRVSYGAGTTLGNLGFYYGGYLNNNTNPLWSGPPLATSTMIMLNLDSGVLSNNTGYDSIGRAEGVMVSIPASAAGMLVYFGGVSFPYGNSTEVAMNMTEIILYDIGDAKWYSQTASGDIPGNRRKFCAGATWADDQSSYNIYLYGGFGFGENATGFDDVYILTLPTFEWIKWYPTGNASGTPSPHGMLTCNVVDMGQMIVMGGNFTNSTACDVPTAGGQHNLDLGQVDSDGAMWYRYQPNLTGYAVPTTIESAVGGVSTGGATRTAPTKGFDDAALSVYFGKKAQFTSRTPTRYIPTSTGTSSSNSVSSSHTGAIVGGVVGGVGGLVLVCIAGLLWWVCLKRRSRRKSQQQQQQQQHFGPGFGTWPPQSPSGLQEPDQGDKIPVSPISGAGGGGILSDYPYSPGLTASTSTTTASPILQQHQPQPQSQYQQNSGSQISYPQYPIPPQLPQPQQQQYPSGQEYCAPSAERQRMPILGTSASGELHEMPVRGMTPFMQQLNTNYNHNLQQPVAQRPVLVEIGHPQGWEATILASAGAGSGAGAGAGTGTGAEAQAGVVAGAGAGAGAGTEARGSRTGSDSWSWARSWSQSSRSKRGSLL